MHSEGKRHSGLKHLLLSIPHSLVLLCRGKQNRKIKKTRSGLEDLASQPSIQPSKKIKNKKIGLEELLLNISIFLVEQSTKKK
jgi:hypothetical protein